MSVIRDPFDPNTDLSAGCSCGHHTSQVAHDQAVVETAAEPVTGTDTEQLMADAVESAVVRSVFGFNDAS